MVHLSRSDLFSQNPFDGFDAAAYSMNIQGWGSEHPIFRKVLAKARPELVIEVGTWKGASAIHMAQCLQELELNARMICVDTWLGAVEFWGDKTDPERYLSLGLKHGYPTVYYQFLANVVKTGFQDVIIPFPQTSVIAARWFRQHNIQAEVIYVDASHEEEDVFRDLCDYWQVLAPGGIMFGDDYDEYWPGVCSAVRRFARVTGVAVGEEDRKWTIQRPLDWQPVASGGNEATLMHLTNSLRFEVIGQEMSLLVNSVRGAHQEVLGKMGELVSKDREMRAVVQQLLEKEQQIERQQRELQMRNEELHSLRMQMKQWRSRLVRCLGWLVPSAGH